MKVQATQNKGRVLGALIGEKVSSCRPLACRKPYHCLVGRETLTADSHRIASLELQAEVGAEIPSLQTVTSKRQRRRPAGLANGRRTRYTWRGGRPRSSLGHGRTSDLRSDRLLPTFRFGLFNPRESSGKRGKSGCVGSDAGELLMCDDESASDSTVEVNAVAGIFTVDWLINAEAAGPLLPISDRGSDHSLFASVPLRTRERAGLANASLNTAGLHEALCPVDYPRLLTTGGGAIGSDRAVLPNNLLTI